MTNQLNDIMDAQRILLEARKALGITRTIEQAFAWTCLADAFMHLQDNFQQALSL